MKIEGPNRTAGTKGASKTDTKKRTGDAGFSNMVSDAGEAEPTAAVSKPSAVTALDALLTLQGAEEGLSKEASKRARQRAEELLDQLDKVKIGLLTGELSVATLQDLPRTIGQHRDKVMDPKLAEILDDIDLRAQVELAKLQ